MTHNKYLNASPNSKPWRFSIILSIGMIVSFFLPWWGVHGRASAGSFSFSNSFSASPMDQFEFFYLWFIFSILCLVFAYKRWWFAIFPALLNLKMATNAMGMFGDGYSSSYSGYGGSFSGSAGLSFGFYLFFFSAAFYAIANINEIIKFIRNLIDPSKMNELPSMENTKTTGSVMAGFIPPKTTVQNKRTLEELKQAKELFDTGVITQEEFDQIKQQALGPKAIITDKEKVQLYDKMEKEKQQAFEHEKPMPRPVPVEPVKKAIPVSNAQSKPVAQKKKGSKMFLVIGASVLILSTVSMVYFFTSHEKEKDNLPDESKTINDYDQEMLEGDDKAYADLEKSEKEQAGDENEGEVDSSSYHVGFLATSTGERYKKVKVQVPNHDEANSTSEIEFTGPVEGMYINKNDYNTRSIQINYDGDKIYVIHWNDSESAKREDAYVTSNGYLSFGSEEFEYDRYGETVTEVQNLSLVGRFTGQVFVWNTEWQGD